MRIQFGEDRGDGFYCFRILEEVARTSDTSLGWKKGAPEFGRQVDKFAVASFEAARRLVKMQWEMMVGNVTQCTTQWSVSPQKSIGTSCSELGKAS